MRLSLPVVLLALWCFVIFFGAHIVEPRAGIIDLAAINELPSSAHLLGTDALGHAPRRRADLSYHWHHGIAHCTCQRYDDRYARCVLRRVVRHLPDAHFGHDAFRTDTPLAPFLAGDDRAVVHRCCRHLGCRRLALHRAYGAKRNAYPRHARTRIGGAYDGHRFADDHQETYPAVLRRSYTDTLLTRAVGRDGDGSGHQFPRYGTAAAYAQPGDDARPCHERCPARTLVAGTFARYDARYHTRTRSRVCRQNEKRSSLNNNNKEESRWNKINALLSCK